MSMNLVPSNALLLRFLIAEIVALVLVSAVVFGHAVWLRWCARRDGPLLALARADLIERVDQDSHGEGTLDPELCATFRRLPGQQQIDLFSSMASSLGGGQRAALTRFATELGLVEHAEGLCHSRFWWRRLHGCRLMTLIGAGENVVPALFQDRNPEVRAQAAEWTSSHPTPENVAALVTQLASPSMLCRFSVQDSLLRLGSPAIEPLAEYLSTHDGTEVQAALEVAVGMADPRFLASALKLCRDASPDVRALATALIGALGGDESLPMLLELLDDSAADVRAAAAEALGRLGHVTSASALAMRLRDRAWDVRRAAALALRDFGAPGILYLRRALNDTDPYAADMARQLLDISALVRDAT